MGVGIALYKRTSDLTVSEPGINANGTYTKGGRLYEVPLHNNDQQYGTVQSGLIMIQQDQYSNKTVNYFNQPARVVPNMPPMVFPGKAKLMTKNGCPLSMSTSTRVCWFDGSLGSTCHASPPRPALATAVGSVPRAR